MHRADKNDDDLKVHLSSRLKADLNAIAKRNDRTLSDYVRHILTKHAYIEICLQKLEGAEPNN